MSIGPERRYSPMPITEPTSLLRRDMSINRQQIQSATVGQLVLLFVNCNPFQNVFFHGHKPLLEEFDELLPAEAVLELCIDWDRGFVKGEHKVLIVFFSQLAWILFSLAT